MHGDRSQTQRQNTLDSFRNGKIKVLVATDIAACGLNIPLVELVVNFDLPDQKKDYVHRIGHNGQSQAVAAGSGAGLRLQPSGRRASSRSTRRCSSRRCYPP